MIYIWSWLARIANAIAVSISLVAISNGWTIIIFIRNAVSISIWSWLTRIANAITISISLVSVTYRRTIIISIRNAVAISIRSWFFFSNNFKAKVSYFRVISVLDSNTHNVISIKSFCGN